MRLLCAFLLFSPSVWASSIPGQLSTTDVEKAARMIGMGGATKLLRSAEPYPSWPGLKIGAEVSFFPGNRLLELGDRSGSATAFQPIPRIFLAKGIAERVEFIGSFFFSGLNTLSSVGGILKWTAIPESEEWISLAAFGGYSSVTAFRGEFSGWAAEFGAVISKDYVRFRPYIGAAWMFAGGQFDPTLVASGVSAQTGPLFGTHVFVGTEWELPINLTLQADLTNLDPSITLFIGKKF